MKNILKNSMKKKTITISESRLKEIIKEELKNVIHKEGNKWKIRGHKGKGNNEADGDWAADYKSKESAEAALRGYFAKKG